MIDLSVKFFSSAACFLMVSACRMIALISYSMFLVPSVMELS